MAEIEVGRGPLYDLVYYVMQKDRFVEVMSSTRTHLIDGDMKEDTTWLLIVRDSEDYDARAVADIVDGDIDKAAGDILTYLKEQERGRKPHIRIEVT